MSKNGLPAGWEWARLGDLGVWHGGGTPSKTRPDYWENGSIPWLSPKDMGSEVISETRDRITEGALQETAVRLVPHNSVAIVTRSGVLEHSLPIALTSVATTLNQDMKAVTPYTGVSPKWITWGLRAFEEKILDQCRKAGTTVASISTPAFMELPFPVPPLAEQHRIVEALDSQFSFIKSGVEAIENTRARCMKLKHSLISRAVSGSLIKPSSSITSIEELLSQIEQEVAASKPTRKRQPGASPKANHGSKLPSGWSLQALGNLATAIDYGTSSKTHKEYQSGDVPVIRMGNIKHRNLEMQDLKYLPGDDSDVVKLTLYDGDLLFNRTNSAELVGKSAVYRSRLGPATFASYLIRCKLATGVEPDWVNLYMSSPQGREYIESVTSQQTGQANVNGAKLASFPIPLPPHEEQLNILSALSSWEEPIEKMTQMASSSVRRAKSLRKALLTHAFTGNLVPQDPTDEPASELLARVQAERAADTKAKGKTGRKRKGGEAGRGTAGTQPDRQSSGRSSSTTTPPLPRTSPETSHSQDEDARGGSSQTPVRTTPLPQGGVQQTFEVFDQ